MLIRYASKITTNISNKQKSSHDAPITLGLRFLENREDTMCAGTNQILEQDISNDSSTCQLWMINWKKTILKQ